MNWKVLHNLFEGFLGKSLLVIALATPISFLVGTNFNLNYFIISLIGALMILVGYVWAIISTPSLIKDFQNGHFYAKGLIELEDYVDTVSEFKVLEENQSKLKENFDGYFHLHCKFTDIESSINNIGERQSIRSLAILKFNLIDNYNFFQRWSLTAIFLLGSAMLYLPSICRVLILLGVEF